MNNALGLPGAEVFADGGLQRLADAVTHFQSDHHQVADDAVGRDSGYTQTGDHHPVE